MGYICHHAIMVIGFRDEDIQRAHARAMDDFKDIAPVSEVMKSPLNNYVSFVVSPDGSKEGWTDSHRGDAAREMFKDWLRTAGDRDIYLTWAEVEFPEDGEPSVCEPKQ